MRTIRLTFCAFIFGFTIAVEAGLDPKSHVFVILMENHNWASIKGSPDAPYINNTLLPQASYCDQYYNPSGLHPSEPNYLWLEAGTNFGVTNDNPPSANHQTGSAHFVTRLKNAGISWTSSPSSSNRLTISRNLASESWPWPRIALACVSSSCGRGEPE